MNPQKPELLDLPSVYAVEVFSKCNLACPMCPTGIERGRHNSQTSEINPILVRSLALHSLKNTKFIELQFRGEPTLHKDLDKIIDILQEVVPYVGLSTHAGTLGSKRVLESLLKLQYITFSIDGVEEAYERIRKGNKYKKVLENLRKFFDARGSSSYPIVDIQTVEVPDTDFELQSQLVQELIENEGWNANFRTMQDTLTWQNSLVKKEGGELCGNPWKSVNIKANGDVVPCCLAFDDSEEMTYGNLYENSLHEIWHGERATKFREAHLNGSQPVFCKACTFRSPYKFHEELILVALESIK